MLRAVSAAAALLLLPLLLAGCGHAVGGVNRSGSLAVSVTELSTQTGSSDQQKLTPVSYSFHGSGPHGESFLRQLEQGSFTEGDLAAGQWHVEVEALNSDDIVIYHGWSEVEVEPYSAVTLSIQLQPLEGSGSIAVTLLWNGELTVDPRASVTLTDASGQTAGYPLAITASGRAEAVLEGLATGVYRVALELSDSGRPVTGNARALRVFNGIELELNAELDSLNKVGQPVEIAEEHFTVAWDSPDDYQPEAYRIYARLRGERDWQLLGESAADQPQFTIGPQILPYGSWELAVSAVAGGSESELHSSMCDDAQPATGWYVQWTGELE